MKPVKCFKKPCVPARWRHDKDLVFVRRCQVCRHVLSAIKTETRRLDGGTFSADKES
jgi:hypothetical protein